MRSTQLDAMLEECGLVGEVGDDLRAALAPLQQPDTTSPTPSAALAALFPTSDAPAGPAAPATPVTPLRTRGRRAVSGALVLALAGVGATGLSAAANTLPAPWQQNVSEFSHRYLPFDLPEPRLTPRSRQPLSGAPQPRTTGERLSPAPKRHHAPRADAAPTAHVPQRATKDVADVRPAATPATGPMTTTRPAPRHAWAAPAPSAAPTEQPKTTGQKSTGPQKSSETPAPTAPTAAAASSPTASPSATFAAAPPKNGKNGKGAKDTGAKSANPQDTGKRSGGQDSGQNGGQDSGQEGGPTVTPMKAPAPVPVTGPISGPVEGPTTGPVLDVVRGSGGKGGPGDDTSGPGDLVESGQHEQTPKADPPATSEKPAKH